MITNVAEITQSKISEQKRGKIPKIDGNIWLKKTSLRLTEP
jgi:hypothetical protein